MHQFWRGIWKCQNNQEARAAFLDFESLKIKRQFFSTLKGKFVVSLGIGHTVESLWHTDVTQFYIRKAHLNICLNSSMQRHQNCCRLATLIFSIWIFCMQHHLVVHYFSTKIKTDHDFKLSSCNRWKCKKIANEMSLKWQQFDHLQFFVNIIYHTSSILFALLH